MRRALVVAIVAAGGACGTIVGVPPNDAPADSGIDGGVEAATEAATEAGASNPAALAFAASSLQYVDCPPIAVPADFTLQLWIRPHSRGAETMVVGQDRRYLPNNQFRIGLRASGEVYFAMADSNASSFGLVDYADAAPYAIHSGTPLDLDRWTHVAVAKSAAVFALAVDGVVVSTVNAGSPDFARNSVDHFRIAAQTEQDGGVDGTFDGALDDVRLYRVARTIEQIRSDMRTEIGPTSDGWADLVSYWRFDEGAGTIAHEDTHRVDGTLVNGPTWISPGAF